MILIRNTGIKPLLLFCLVLTVLAGATSCTHEGGSEKKLFTLLPSSVTKAGFINHLDYDEQLKTRFNIYTFRNFYNGSGVALGDINNDGLMDILMGSNMGSCVLYLNKGNFNFEDISEKSGITGKGWTTGVSCVDINGDGLLDFYLCKSGNSADSLNRNQLYINNGDLTFTEKAHDYGLDEQGNSTQGVFFDYDRDGDLDLYLLKNFPKAIGSFDLRNNQRLERDTDGGHKLFRNDKGKFTDVSAEAGIYGSNIAFGLGVTVGDLNQDGWMDIYVSNDFFERDYLYLNNHDGTFTENLTRMMRSISAASMGADIADLNNDHYPEVFATDMLPEHNDRLKTKTTFDDWNNYKSNVVNGYHHQFTRNVLQLNNGDSTFSEIGRMAGINATDWSWGALIFDLNNDGLKDIFVANGIYKDLTDQDYIQYFSNRDMVMSIISGNNIDYKTLIDAIPSVKIPSYAFKNTGNYRFENVADEWGLGSPGFSNGAAYGDFDNDGDLDLIVNNVNMPMYVYRNESRQKMPENHYLKLILNGEGENRFAVGAEITIKVNGKNFYIEQMPMRGYLSTVDSRPNIGLGAVTVIDSLVIEWPDSRITLLTGVKTDQTLTLYQKDAVPAGFDIHPAQWRRKTLMSDISGQNLINYVQHEDDFDDFERDKLLYNMMSTEGPRMCKGDVNGDGLDDVYICGPKGQAGALMLQQQNGSFISSEQELFEADRISEETDCEFFDADGDGDKDLYVACGSNEFPESSSALADRLYFNDGNGHFTKSDQVLPAGKYESTACVKAADFDNDGITELFVGLRLKPFLYGVPVSGYILENDGKGNLSDVTGTLAPELINAGMIRDMEWADVDKDGDKDIILAGDWMPIKIYINDNGTFKEKKDAFVEETSGWWNCITASDFDGDGDIDFIAGNHGLNSRFKASSKKPVSMYVNDFDLNGTAEQIICTYDGDKSYPLALRHDLIKQIPNLEKKCPTYDAYKDQQISDLFTADQLKSSVHVEAALLETSLFINDGKGSFSRKALPAEVQFSPVYAAFAGDVNGDGNTDILLGGNLFNAKPETGSYDANYGVMLSGNGHGEFSYVAPLHSGFRLEGEIRDIVQVNTGAGKLLLVGRSNDPLQVFKLKSN